MEAVALVKSSHFSIFQVLLVQGRPLFEGIVCCCLVLEHFNELRTLVEENEVVSKRNHLKFDEPHYSEAESEITEEEKSVQDARDHSVLNR